MQMDIQTVYATHFNSDHQHYQGPVHAGHLDVKVAFTWTLVHAVLSPDVWLIQ